jgi:hypothetical protein
VNGVKTAGAAAYLATSRPRTVSPFVLEKLAPVAVPCEGRQHTGEAAYRASYQVSHVNLRGCGSLKAREEALRCELVSLWVAFALEVGNACPIVAAASEPKVKHLTVLFSTRSPGTLRRHIGGWRRWAKFAVAAGISLGAPSLAEVMDFCAALVEGSRSDRGSQRGNWSRGAVSSMKFVASRLKLDSLLKHLSEEVVTAWAQLGKWDRVPTKEAKPLPLHVVVAFEIAMGISEADVSFLLGVVLLMVWGSLRWSDVQRVRITDFSSDQDSIRAWSWRTKSSVSGMPFGALSHGLTGRRWGATFFKMIEDLAKSNPQRDFLVGSDKSPWEYSTMLGQFRRLLVQVGGLAPSEAASFTLQSCKATVLSWSLQIGIVESDRAAQGHHRAREASGCVRKYGRNDVIPALRCQQAVLTAAAAGWLPRSSGRRGAEPETEEKRPAVALQHPGELLGAPREKEPGIRNDLAEQGLEHEPSEAALSDVDSDVGEAEVPNVTSHVLVEKPDAPQRWILNTFSGIYHAAAWRDNTWRKACKPAAVLGSHYDVKEADPALEGHSICKHIACDM